MNPYSENEQLIYTCLRRLYGNVVSGKVIHHKKIDFYFEIEELGVKRKFAVETRLHNSRLNQKVVSSIYANHAPLFEKHEIDHLLIISELGLSDGAISFVEEHGNIFRHLTVDELQRKASEVDGKSIRNSSFIFGQVFQLATIRKSSVLDLTQHDIRDAAKTVILNASDLAALLQKKNDKNSIAPGLNTVEYAALISALETLTKLLQASASHVAVIDGVTEAISDIAEDAAKEASTDFLKDGLVLLAKSLKDLILSGIS